MRILHVSMLYPPHVIGGAERSVALLAEAQSAAGHMVFAACTTPEKASREIRNGVAIFRMPHETLFWAEDWPQQKPIKRLWRKAMMPFNHRLSNHFAKLLDELQPDIVHTHSMVDVSTRLWATAARKSYPLVHTLRDYDLLCTDGAMYHGGKGCGVKCQTLTIPKHRHHLHIGAVAANSRATMDIHLNKGLFSHIPETRREIIWNIASQDEAQPAAPRRPLTGEIIFGYFGRINEEKGIETLLRAAERLHEDGVPFRILVGGKSDRDMDAILERAKNLPVDFLGFVEADHFFPQIDVLVISSIWPEPLPRTGLEAYAAGVPVLGSTAGGTPDIIGHDNHAWLFTPADDDMLAQRMRSIVTRGRENLPTSDSFSTVLAETSPSVVLSRYQRLYDKVLHQ